ncbi:unnamed protein product [Urochloa decumbens]|uniref:RRM domain-containing protein n=1 Tax=Urochloa decumbens TaxID=240449 RepID=A0ABC8VR34_9POAL
MEGSGGSPLPQQPPPADKDADEAAALALTKRARKRSRYLSPPYTDTDVQEVVEEVADEEEEEPPNVSAAEALSALGAAAQGQEGVDPAALRFLALYRNRNRATTGTFDDSPAGAAASGSQQGGSKKPPSPASAGGGGHTMLNLSPAALSFLANTVNSDGPRAAAGDGSHGGGSNKPPSPAAATSGGVGHTMLNFSAGPAMPGPSDGSSALALAKKRKNPNADGPMQNAGALGQAAATAAAAGHIRASQLPGFAVNAAHGVANPVPLEKKRRKKYKKRMKIAGHEQHYFGNPAALVLDFAAGTHMPSKEDLVSTFRRFGLVIDSGTTIAHDTRRARVAFATRAQAEAAYSCEGALGAFGPPSVAPSLLDLPPIGCGAPPPVPKLPLTDIKSNLENMIASLNHRSLSVKATAEVASLPEEAMPAILVGEMQGLLAKVNKKLQGRSITAHHG